MRVCRIQFDNSEPTDSIARRIACAFDPGNVIRIRDDFFKMSSLKVMNQTVASNVIGDNYTLILNPEEPVPENLLKAQAPPPVAVKEPEPEPEPEEDDLDDEVESVETVVEPEPAIEPITPEPIKVLINPEVESQPPPEVLEEPVVLAEVDPVPVQPPSDSVPPPPTSEVLLSRPPPSIDGKPLIGSDSKSKSGEYRIEIPKSKIQVEVGQVWQSKDTRRQSPPFVVVSIDNEFVYQDNGRKISLDRMFRYKRVS